MNDRDRIQVVKEFKSEMIEFIVKAYDISEWPKDFIDRLVDEMFGEFILLVCSNFGDIRKCKKSLVYRLYREFEIKPRNFSVKLQWELWLEACNSHDDKIAARLLDDGFNVGLRQPGFHSARNYAKKNRDNLPVTWSRLCRDELEKKAAKQRRRSPEVNLAAEGRAF